MKKREKLGKSVTNIRSRIYKKMLLNAFEEIKLPFQNISLYLFAPDFLVEPYA
jgi:hypothetical protein